MEVNTNTVMQVACKGHPSIWRDVVTSVSPDDVSKLQRALSRINPAWCMPGPTHLKAND